MRFMINIRMLKKSMRQRVLTEKELEQLKSFRCLVIACCENLKHLFEGIENLTSLETIMIDYQIMTPEDIESFTTGNRSPKAALENPFHVFGHQPPKTYTTCPTTVVQPDIIIAAIAPLTPQLNLFTNIHDNNT
ncbi:hypothetical protein QQP08_016188 [Theobroma cacao]|nr:hypothetical protein QQP08_016188 [Theobroma cacao]